ncbi:VOC family protein [Deinococcus altitudinis]|uniref:VOC family protein n=1 Tax=Deinococcus altitudinis TaxID=468914 RepID=UPI00389189AD
MKNPVQGLHHVTVMAADAQRNVDFYSQTLAQRMVKVTVNFDDPGTYHLYYGDKVGSPGTVMTHFPWQGARRGVRGNGEAVATAYSVKPGSLPYWRERLSAGGFKVGETLRFGQTVLNLEDPDGTWIELVADDGLEVPQPWADGPVAPQDALHGFHSVTLWVNDHQPIHDLLVGQLGFRAVGSESDTQTADVGGVRHRYQGAGAGVGLYVDAVERKGQPKGTFGAGSIHHVALRTVNDAEQAEYLSQLRAAGYGATSVQDRQYFHSIYFREPNGVLFEIATDAPGFDDDESVDRLGSTLKLPSWFESRRGEIERRVPRITNREYGNEIGGGTSGQVPNEQVPSEQPRSGEAASVQAPAQRQVPSDPNVLHAGRPVSEARVAMVLIHGRGGTAADILSLGEQWNQSVYAYLAPQAPGNTWYPQSFLAPIEQNQPHLDNALARLDALMAELNAAGIPPERVILGGFSQGACLVSEYVARNPRRYGGVFVFSGGLITLKHSGDLEGTPMFMGNSDRDSHIPHARFEESAAVFAALNAQVDARVYPGMPHTIVQDELDAVGHMMQALSLASV